MKFTKIAPPAKWMASTKWAVGAGALLFFLYYLPFLILGGNSYHRIDDNLDSEIFFNVLSARNFFRFSGVVPELMDIDVRAVNSFSVFQLLFYAIFPPFTAYLLNDMVVRITAYIGMYLFLRAFLKFVHPTVTDRPALFIVTCVICSAIFSILPYYTVYGLTSAGLPLLAWAFFGLLTRTRLAVSYACIVFYTLSSSFILTGWWIVGGLGAVMIVCAVKKIRLNKHFYIAPAVMFALYILMTLKTISLVFSGYTSHREMWNDKSIDIDILYYNMPFTQWVVHFWRQLTIGFYHVQISSIIALICACVCIGLSVYKRKTWGRLYYALVALPCVTFGILVYVMIVRSPMFFHGIVQTFHIAPYISFERLYYVLPLIVIMTVAVCFIAFYDLIADAKTQARNYLFYSSVGVVTLFYFLIAILPNQNNITTWQTNLFATFGARPDYPSFNQFYDTKLYDGIAEYLESEGYGKRTEYRVGTTSQYKNTMVMLPNVLLPVSASYNGFHCVDGFAQNQSMEYWQKFNRIMTDEYLGTCADWGLNWWYNWGNRLYIIGDGFDVAEFYDIGGRFIFSSYYFENPALEYMRAFKSPKGYYTIYLYKAVI